MAQLRRELGRWDLTAIGINQVIGGAVFALPAALAAAFLALGGAALLALGGLLALVGLWFYEDAWVRAGQSVPLS